MSDGYYQKNKEGFEKRLMEGIKIFLKKIKTKSKKMFLNNIEIILKKKKEKAPICLQTI